MAEYCTPDNVVDLGSQLGLELAARPQASADDVTASGIIEAGIEIDGYVSQVSTPEIARALGDATLRSIAAALTVEYVASYGGAFPSAQVVQRAAFVRGQLERISTRQLPIKGLVRPEGLKTSFKRKRVFNATDRPCW